MPRTVGWNPERLVGDKRNTVPFHMCSAIKSHHEIAGMVSSVLANSSKCC